MTKPKKTPKEWAEEHWSYIESLLYQQRLMEKKLFVDAFIHGYLHGREDRK